MLVGISKHALDMRAKQYPRSLQWVMNLFDGRLHLRPNPLERRSADEIQKIFLALDVIVQRSFLNAEKRRDLASTGGGIAFSRKQCDGGLQQALRCGILCRLGRLARARRGFLWLRSQIRHCDRAARRWKR